MKRMCGPCQLQLQLSPIFEVYRLYRRQLSNAVCVWRGQYGCHANWTSAALQVCRRLEAFTYNNWSMSWPQNHKFWQKLIFSLTQTSLGSIVPCCHSFDPSKSSRVPWHPGHRAASAHPDSRHVHCLVKENIRLFPGWAGYRKINMCRDMCPDMCLYLHYSSLRIHGGAMMIGPDRRWRFLKWRVTFVYLKSTNSRCPKNVLEPIDDQFHLMTLVRPWRSTPAKKKRPKALAWHWESPQGWRKGECSIAEN